MSELLERMIQRARGPLSSVEPLAKPRFAAVQLSGHAWADAAGLAGLADSADEADALASGRDPSPDRRPGARRRRPPARPTGDVAGDDGSEPVAAVPAAARAGPTRAMATPDRPPPGRSAAPGPPAVTWHAERDYFAPGPDPVAVPIGRTDRGPHDVRERDIREELATAAAAAEPAPVPAWLLPARRNPGSPSPPGQAGDLSGSGPTVTISIGHIEVRAAPAVEERRVRPAFRPRVGLADFLGQDRRP
jgi:hypothetical protein